MEWSIQKQIRFGHNKPSFQKKKFQKYLAVFRQHIWYFDFWKRKNREKGRHAEQSKSQVSLSPVKKPFSRKKL